MMYELATGELGTYGIMVFVVILVLGFWKIFSKAGFPGWWSLTILVPLFSPFVFLYLAFARWPTHRLLLKTSAGEVADPNFDKVLKHAAGLEAQGELCKALAEYQNIVEDAKSCIAVINRRLTELGKSGDIA